MRVVEDVHRDERFCHKMCKCIKELQKQRIMLTPPLGCGHPCQSRMTFSL